MKKYLIAIVALLSTALANAQFDFGYGFKAGLNFATYSSDCDDIQARPGQYGILCRLKFGSSFAIQPEVFYSRQGVRSLEFLIAGHYDDAPYNTLNPTNDQEKFRLLLLNDCVQMPIMLKYYLPINLYGFNVQAGPLFSQRFEYRVSTPSPLGYLRDSSTFGRSLTSKNDFARDQNKATMGINTGIGFDSPSGIGLDVRCYFGLTPVFKTLYRNARDRVWSISFTYLL